MVQFFISQRDDLVKKILHPQTGIELKDRVFHFKKYKRTFKGEDAIHWLLNNKIVNDKVSAIALGNAMLVYGIFSHILNERDFEDSPTVYRILVSSI